MKNQLSPVLKTSFGKFVVASVGNALVFLRPKKAKELSEKGLTIVSTSNNMSIPERLMRSAILKKSEKKRDYNALETLHKNFWANKGQDFFVETESSFEKEFLPNCAFIFDELETKLMGSYVHYNTLVEIGTGNGKVLNYLSLKFPNIEHFIGIDLSAAQIELNNKNFNGNPKLEFVAADGFDWVRQHGGANTIFVTSRGVLEYFTEERLQAFFNEVNSLGKIIFIAIEPKGNDHDYMTQTRSQPYGTERSFSHNYPKLFENAGFKLWHVSYKPFDHFSMMGFMGVEN